MRRLRAAALALTAGAGAASAQEVACGEPYTIRQGDTLQKIAEQVYGPEASYEILYNANRGRHDWWNPSHIEVGEVIDIPCPEGSAASGPGEASAPDAAAPESVAPQGAEVLEAAEVVEEAEVAEDAPDEPEAPQEASIRVAVTTAGGEREAAAAAALARAAFAATPGDPVRLDFVEGRPEPLALAAEGYALSLPWPAPDCAAADALSASARKACAALVWSEPVYERVVSAYLRAEPAAPEPPVRLCLPSLLRMLGLYHGAEATIEGGAETCFRALVEERVDVAAASTEEARAALAQLPAAAAVAEIYELTRIVPLAAAGPADDAEAEALAARLDSGLEALRSSGDWFETVRTALAPE